MRALLLALSKEGARREQGASMPRGRVSSGLGGGKRQMPRVFSEIVRRCEGGSRPKAKTQGAGQEVPGSRSTAPGAARRLVGGKSVQSSASAASRAPLGAPEEALVTAAVKTLRGSSVRGSSVTKPMGAAERPPALKRPNAGATRAFI